MLTFFYVVTFIYFVLLIICRRHFWWTFSDFSFLLRFLRHPHVEKRLLPLQFSYFSFWPVHLIKRLTCFAVAKASSGNASLERSRKKKKTYARVEVNLFKNIYLSEKSGKRILPMWFFKNSIWLPFLGAHVNLAFFWSKTKISFLYLKQGITLLINFVIKIFFYSAVFIFVIIFIFLQCWHLRCTFLAM